MSRYQQRFYVIRIAYNKVAQAEDRPQPVGFDTFDEAKKAFHSYLSQNILQETIAWYLCMIIDQNGRTLLDEKWEAPFEPEFTPEPETQTTE